MQYEVLPRSELAESPYHRFKFAVLDFIENRGNQNTINYPDELPTRRTNYGDRVADDSYFWQVHRLELGDLALTYLYRPPVIYFKEGEVNPEVSPANGPQAGIDIREFGSRYGYVQARFTEDLGRISTSKSFFTGTGFYTCHPDSYRRFSRREGDKLIPILVQPEENEAALRAYVKLTQKDEKTIGRKVVAKYYSY